MEMQALTDASGCFASMEKVHDPSIRQKPVVVLSNNDGCIVAICPMAKKLGIPKFEPYFKVKYLLAEHNVVIRSSNYELYGDISDKMMAVIARFSDNTYQYSIDESFSKFINYEGIIKDWYNYGHEIRRTVWRETRMPVGVGFGHTLTLAKAANHASKKLSDSDGVAVIDDDYSKKHYLQQMKLDDVWGIGRKISSKLGLLGLKTAYDLANSSPKAMRQQFGVTVERTIEELNGVKCLHWDDVRSPKKEIYSTRSVGQRITSHVDLRKALTTHAIKVCNKVRQQHCLIKKLYIFAASSPHDERYIKKGIMYDFPLATDNVFSVANAIEQVLHVLYVEGVPYYRCGVGAVELESGDFQQQDLFLSKENPALMNCYNNINSRFGKGALQLGSEARQEKWSMRREFLSPRWTTRWSDIPTILC
jgi:DNA polymerase V